VAVIPRTLVEEAHIDDANRIVFHTDPSSPRTDRFRFLRMRLRELWNTKKLRVFLITSPLPEDGKSTITVNLATALAEGGKRFVLMVASAYSLTDELHQVFSRGRHASLIGGIDTPGAAIVIFLVYGARGSLLRSSSTGFAQ
jgi:hypothetical protein